MRKSKSLWNPLSRFRFGDKKRKSRVQPKGRNLALEPLEARMLLDIGAAGETQDDTLEVTRFTEIVDNRSDLYTEEGTDWEVSTLGDSRDGDVRYVEPGDGSSKATWRFDDLQPGGQYQVLATWSTRETLTAAPTRPTTERVEPIAPRDRVIEVDDPTDWRVRWQRASSAPFTIYDGADAQTRVVQATMLANQQFEPNDVIDAEGSWESLGVYTIDSGTITVELSNDTDGVIIADAVRVVEVPDVLAPTDLADDGDLAYSQRGSRWLSRDGHDAFNGDYRYHEPGVGENTVDWEFSGLIPNARYRVLTTWDAHSNRATDAKYTITAATADPRQPLETIAEVNQKAAPAALELDSQWWADLGVHSSEDGTLTVSLSDDADGLVIADAVRIIPEGSVQSLEGVTEIISGRTLPLSAETFDPDASVREMAFFRDSDGDNLLNPSIDQLLGIDVDGTDGWSLSVATKRMPLGEHAFFAQSTTDQGVVDYAAEKITISSAAAIIHQGDLGYAEQGDAWTDGSFMRGRDEDDTYRIVHTPGSTNSATWTFDDLAYGTYQVYTRHIGLPNHGRAVPLNVYAGDTDTGQLKLATTVNQAVAPRDFEYAGVQWSLLGEVTLDANRLTVEAVSEGQTDQWVAADSVLIVRDEGTEVDPVIAGSGAESSSEKKASGGQLDAKLYGSPAKSQSEPDVAITGFRADGEFRIDYTIDYDFESSFDIGIYESSDGYYADGSQLTTWTAYGDDQAAGPHNDIGIGNYYYESSVDYYPYLVAKMETYDGDSGNDLYAFDGGEGNDYIDVSNSYHSDTTYIYGGGGDDTIYGGYYDNEIHGGADDDAIDISNSSGSYSYLYGGSELHGGDDNDILYGGSSDDFLYGDGGDDYLDGGEGDDFLFGGDDSDYYYGGEAGNDTFDGGLGTDSPEVRVQGNSTTNEGATYSLTLIDGGLSEPWWSIDWGDGPPTGTNSHVYADGGI